MKLTRGTLDIINLILSASGGEDAEQTEISSFELHRDEVNVSVQVNGGSEMETLFIDVFRKTFMIFECYDQNDVSKDLYTNWFHWDTKLSAVVDLLVGQGYTFNTWR